MIDELKKSLFEMQFSPKEADLYLTLLQSGPASVQELAEKAGLNRTTAYVVIEALQARGLVSLTQNGKKVRYAAENPERLLFLMDQDVALARARLARIQDSVPHMLALFHGLDDKPNVRYFEGAEAIVDMRREMIESRQPIEEVCELFSVDEVLFELLKIQPEQRFAVTRRVGRVRALMAIKPGFVPPLFDRRKVEARVMEYGQTPFSGEVAFMGSRIYVFAGQTKGLGLVIESAEIVKLIRAIYEGAWQHAKPWIPPENWGKAVDAT